jgi:hypothetical protein
LISSAFSSVGVFASTEVGEHIDFFISRLMQKTSSSCLVMEIARYNFTTEAKINILKINKKGYLGQYSILFCLRDNRNACILCECERVFLEEVPQF